MTPSAKGAENINVASNEVLRWGAEEVLGLFEGLDRASIAHRKAQHATLLYGFTAHAAGQARAALLLMDRGLTSDAAPLARVTLEHAATLQWLCQSPDRLDRILAEAEYRRNSLGKHMLKSDNFTLDEATRQSIATAPKTLRMPNPDKLFADVDPSGWLYVMHLYLLAYVHPSGHAMTRHVADGAANEHPANLVARAPMSERLLLVPLALSVPAAVSVYLDLVKTKPFKSPLMTISKEMGVPLWWTSDGRPPKSRLWRQPAPATRAGSTSGNRLDSGADVTGMEIVSATIGLVALALSVISLRRNIRSDSRRAEAARRDNALVHNDARRTLQEDLNRHPRDKELAWEVVPPLEVTTKWVPHDRDACGRPHESSDPVLFGRGSRQPVPVAPPPPPRRREGSPPPQEPPPPCGRREDEVPIEDPYWKPGKLSVVIPNPELARSSKGLGLSIYAFGHRYDIDPSSEADDFVLSIDCEIEQAPVDGVPKDVWLAIPCGCAACGSGAHAQRLLRIEMRSAELVVSDKPD